VLEFIKAQATGNDFVLIDATADLRGNWPTLARRLCDRHSGAGADGLLVVLPARAAAGNKAHFRMRMFNPDGTEDMCGNGLRTVAVYLAIAGLEQRNVFAIETIAGIRPVEITEVRAHDGTARVNLGAPKLRGKDIPVAADLEKVVDYPLPVVGRTILVTALSTGTPHAVVFDADPAEIAVLGPAIMAHPFFPEQTTVNLVQVETPARLVARTWERGGVGESLSCGTGALAILAAAHLKGISPRQAEIVFRGGTLRTRWAENNELWLQGPVKFVYRASIKISPQRR
jgi:diaminopimelate epimerase